TANGASGKRWARLRTLHAVRALATQRSAAAVIVVAAADGTPAWVWCPWGQTGVMLVGTDLGSDLVRYRQGDPRAATNRPTEVQWGFPGERPSYLFEAQLAGEAPGERHADWWCEALASALVRHAGVKRVSMLPGGAPGAIVITGDDDQALLDT